MERIGDINNIKRSKNELSCEWRFNIVTFKKSYRSQWLRFLQHENYSGYQLAIVPDDLQHVVSFFLFLYGCNDQSEVKIELNVCFKSEADSDYNVACSKVSSNLGPSMKIFEIHSSHPILFNSDEYVFKLELKLLNDSNAASIFSNTTSSAEDMIEGKNVSSDEFRVRSPTTQNTEYPKEFIQNLRSLHTSKDMCDLNIYIGENVLRAHKLILCAHSPVFKRMMEHDCLESTSNSINITDCSASQFKKFLKYLYTGEIEDRTMDTVMSLYSLGDKYDVPALRNSCSNILQSKLSNESVDDAANIVCDVLQLAECHSDSKLKDLASGFIVNHFPIISKTQCWDDLMKSNFKLTSGILALVTTGLHKRVYNTEQT